MTMITKPNVSLEEGLLHIGWGEADITPTGSVRLAGQFNERISEYVQSPLAAIALAIETKGQDGQSLEQMIWCSLDLVGIYDEFTDQVREEMLRRIPGIPAEKICLNATHTHTAPVLDQGDANLVTAHIDHFVPDHLRNLDAVEAKKKVEVSSEAYWQFLLSRTCDAIEAAWASRSAGMVSWCLGHAAVGFNRRVTYDDGSALMYGNTNTPNYFAPEAGEDHGVELLYTWDKQGELTGALVNIACPSQVVESNYYISADFWGELRRQMPDRMEKPIHILPMCGAAGDISPRDMVRRNRGEPNMREVEGAVEMGRRVLNTVLENRDIAAQDKKDRLIMSHQIRVLPLALRTVSTAENAKAEKEFNAILEAKTPGERLEVSDMYKLHTPGGIMERFQAQKLSTIYHTEVHALRLGDVAFTTNPFELFLRYGLQIKARSRAQQTFIAQLSVQNGWYLPTEIAVAGAHYSAIVASGKCGPEGGKQLVEGTLDMINSMWPQEQ